MRSVVSAPVVRSASQSGKLKKENAPSENEVKTLRFLLNEVRTEVNNLKL